MLDRRILRGHAGEAEPTRATFDAYEPRTPIHGNERDLSCSERLRALEDEDVSRPDAFVFHAAIVHAVDKGGCGTRREQLREFDRVRVEMVGRPGEGHEDRGEETVHYGVRSLTMQAPTRPPFPRPFAFHSHGGQAFTRTTAPPEPNRDGHPSRSVIVAMYVPCAVAAYAFELPDWTSVKSDALQTAGGTVGQR